MKTRYLIAEAYLHVLAFALLGLGLVSLLGFLAVDQPSRHSVVLLPDSALLALLAGALLLAAIRRAWRSLLLCAALLAGLTLYTLVHNHLAGGSDQGPSLVSGFLRMRSGLALILLAIAAAICLGLGPKPARLLAQLIGVAVMLLALLAQLAGQQPSPGLLNLGFKYSSTHVANLFTLLLGLAAVLHSWLPIGQRGQLDRLSQAAGLFGVLLTCAGWYLLSLQAIEALSRESDLLLSKVQTATSRTLDEHLTLIQRMSERWQANGALPSPRLWQQEAGSYLRDFPSLELVAVLDRQLQPHWLEARGNDEAQWLRSFLADGDNQAWLQHVFDDGHAHLSPVRAYGEAAGLNALVATPLSLPGAPTRLLVASLNVHDVMAHVLGPQLSGFIVRAYEHEQPLYDSNQARYNRFNTPVGERLVPIAESTGWRLVSVINRPQALNSAGYLPALVMLFGLTLSFLLMLSQRLAWLANERSQRLARLNDQLQFSLAGQMRAQKLNQRIMQFTLDVLCSVDGEGRFREISPSCEKLFGYKPEELIGRRYLDLVLPEDRQATEAEAAAIMAGRPTRTFRNRYRHRDGQVLHVLWSADWSPEEQTLFAVAHDITALVQNEAYAESQRDILSMISTDRPLREVLEAICQMVEIQQPEALCSVLLLDDNGQHLHTGAAPSLPEAYNRAIDGVAIGPNAGSCGTAAFRKQLVVVEDIERDPLWRDYRELARPHGLRACWSFPLISHQGQVLGTFAIYQSCPSAPDDEQIQQLANAAQLAAIAITRSRDRQRLQESEQRFRSLFTFNPDPVFSLDLQGRFLSLNGAGVQLTGIGEVLIVGEHFSGMIAKADRVRTEQHFAAACTGIPQRYETHILGPDGQQLALDMTNLPIMVDGQIVGIFAIAKDISEREHMTAALHQALERAERKTEQLRGLSAAAIATAKLLDHQALIDYLVEQARLVVGAHQAVLSLTRGDDWAQSISGVSLSDKYAAWRSYATRPDGSGIYALICQDNQPLRLSQAELERHPHWCGFGEHAGKHPPMRGWLAVPLIDKDGRNLGLLQLSDRYEGEFEEDDQVIAQQFAQMAVSVLENSRLFNEVLAGDQRLQQQLEFTSAITDSMAEGLLAVDARGCLSFLNPAAQALLQQGEQGLSGQSLAQVLPLQPSQWPLPTADDEAVQGELVLHGERPRTLLYDARPLSGSGDGGWVIVLRDITAQRLADQALRERNQFFNLSLDMFCMIGQQGQFIQVNPAFASTLRHTASALIGQPYLELIHPEDRRLVENAIEQLQRGAVVKDLEIRVHDSRGQQLWLQLSAALADDQVIYCAARDISLQRAVAEQVRQNSLLLSLAGHIAKLGGWSIELPGRQVVWSEEMHSLLGFPVGTLPDLSEGLQLYPPAYRERVTEAVEDCIEQGIGFDLDVEMLDAHGRHLYVQVAGQAVRDDNGQIVRISGALQDISERKQALKQAQRLAERLTTTLESISDAFYTLDNDWRFTYINPEAERQLNISAAATLGQSVWTAFPGSYDSELGQRYHQARHDNQACHFETFYEPFQRWFEVHAYPSEEGLAVYFQDVSERRANQEQLKRTLLELARSNRELEEFAFVASHDLQEPLRKIQAFSERLAKRSDGLDDDGRDYLQRMTSAAARMQALIIDLLDYSRVNTRGQPLQKLDLDPLLDQVLQDLETALEQSGAQVLREPLPPVRGDASQLRRVLQNLLSNALKFQHAGAKPLIRIYAEHPGDESWVLCIADNGIGFDEKYLDRIFNPFQRLHGREAYAGTGIGLAIVKKIVERHGASITASSALGVGSTFRISFPPMDKPTQ
ncbi:PAS domain S-box protein [Pseudomonas sp. NPDC077186]|uniref:PAS domain S-box protein n=1 Tax=Pseudomonas sp. NPDC077186 TaxID=3364421 RepID=UPI0037C8C0A3